MAAYQRVLGQSEVWESWDGGVAENKAIAEMPPAYALNALHKLARWMEHLYVGSTAMAYERARIVLFESPLVAALIQQALGPFYEGTFLNEDLLGRDEPPHLDDVVAPRGGDVRQRQALIEAQRAVPGQRFEEELLEVSITGAVELEANARESIGARARILYRILAEGITFPTTEAP